MNNNQGRKLSEGRCLQKNVSNVRNVRKPIMTRVFTLTFLLTFLGRPLEKRQEDVWRNHGPRSR